MKTTVIQKIMMMLGTVFILQSGFYLVKGAVAGYCEQIWKFEQIKERALGQMPPPAQP